MQRWTKNKYGVYLDFVVVVDFFYLFRHWLWVKYLTYRKSLKDFEGGSPF